MKTVRRTVFTEQVEFVQGNLFACRLLARKSPATVGGQLCDQQAECPFRLIQFACNGKSFDYRNYSKFEFQTPQSIQNSFGIENFHVHHYQAVEDPKSANLKTKSEILIVGQCKVAKHFASYLEPLKSGCTFHFKRFRFCRLEDVRFAMRISTPTLKLDGLERHTRQYAPLTFKAIASSCPLPLKQQSDDESLPEKFECGLSFEPSKAKGKQCYCYGGRSFRN